MKTQSLIAAAAVLAALPLLAAAGARATSVSSRAVPGANADWKADSAWYDGQAEKAVYRATRTIYGAPREYLATAYTNKQRQDPETTVKAVGDDGLLVFKHHWSERAPTENYDYDFSTATFVDHDTLAPFKLAVGTQEDCGASFKQAVVDGGRMRWLESVYHPGGGLRQDELRAPADLQFEDALTLTLRDFPFDAPQRLSLSLVPSQQSPKRASFEPVAAAVDYAGRESLELPAGRIDAHRLDLTVAGARRASFWFAADGSAPMLHALVRYEGRGLTFELASHERTAYWER